MGTISDMFNSIIEVQRTLDGRIWDYNTQKWLPPTAASLTAADSAVSSSLGAMIDLIPFPLSINMLGIITINITRTQMDSSVSKIQAAIKAYVAATRVMST